MPKTMTTIEIDYSRYGASERITVPLFKRERVIEVGERVRCRRRRRPGTYRRGRSVGRRRPEGRVGVRRRLDDVALDAGMPLPSNGCPPQGGRRVVVGHTVIVGDPEAKVHTAIVVDLSSKGSVALDVDWSSQPTSIAAGSAAPA